MTAIAEHEWSQYAERNVRALLKACEEFTSDCELTNEESRGFHLHTGFEEANRIICFTKKLEYPIR